MRTVGAVLGCVAMVAADVAIAMGVVGLPQLEPRTERYPAQCLHVSPDVPLSRAAVVRSNEHGRVWMLALDLGDAGIGVWAVDHLEHPTMMWSVNGAAAQTSPNVRAADVMEWGRSHLPTGWTDNSGDWQTTDLYGNAGNPAWRSVTVGIDMQAHGAPEAYECVRAARQADQR